MTGRVLDTLGMCFAYKGNFPMAREFYEQSIRYKEALGRRGGRRRQSWATGKAASGLGTSRRGGAPLSGRTCFWRRGCAAGGARRRSTTTWARWRWRGANAKPRPASASPPGGTTPSPPAGSTRASATARKANIPSRRRSPARTGRWSTCTKTIRNERKSRRGWRTNFSPPTSSAKAWPRCSTLRG